MRTINSSTSLSIRGRPGVRRARDPSNLRATSAEVEIFPILGESAATVQPSDRSLDDPALGNGDEPPDSVRAFDDFRFEVGQNRCERRMKYRSLVSAVGE